MKRFAIILAVSGCGSSLDEPVQPPPQRAPSPRVSPRASAAPARRPPPPAKTANRTPAPAASQGNVQADCRPGARNLTCSADRDCDGLTQACRAIAGALAALPFGAGAIPLDVTATCVNGACEMRR